MEVVANVCFFLPHFPFLRKKGRVRRSSCCLCCIAPFSIWTDWFSRNLVWTLFQMRQP